MSKSLDMGTKPKGTIVCMTPYDTDVSFRIPIKENSVNLDVSLIDFLVIAEYVLTNTDLVKDDPRLIFIKRIKESTTGAGYNFKGKRIILCKKKQYMYKPYKGD
jgi:hypothetical protein